MEGNSTRLTLGENKIKFFYSPNKLLFTEHSSIDVDCKDKLARGKEKFAKLSG